MYAGYSNVGPDVDILAPGTCVRSTMPDPTRAQPGDRGTFTQSMTGTSQATPHVTGAVARYLAEQPGTSPEQMRRIVRAAGRLDWDIRSDPLWSGVDDDGQPRTRPGHGRPAGSSGPPVWLSPDRFRVAGASTRRQARVDVQRGGAYAGPVELSVADLPAGVGSAVFDRPGSSLDGLAGLGARLRLTLPAGGDQGPRALSVLATGSTGNLAGSRALDLLVDRKGPTVSGLVARIRGGDSPLDPGGRVPAIVSWSVQDAWSQVAQVTAQRRLGTGRWRTVGSAMSHARVSLAPAHPLRLRVRAEDGLGNGSTSATLPVRLTVRDSSSPAVATPAGGWSTMAVSAARGGSLLVADATASSLRHRLPGHVRGARGARRAAARTAPPARSTTGPGRRSTWRRPGASSSVVCSPRRAAMAAPGDAIPSSGGPARGRAPRGPGRASCILDSEGALVGQLVLPRRHAPGVVARHALGLDAAEPRGLGQGREGPPHGVDERPGLGRPEDEAGAGAGSASASMTVSASPPMRRTTGGVP